MTQSSSCELSTYDGARLARCEFGVRMTSCCHGLPSFIGLGPQTKDVKSGVTDWVAQIAHMTCIAANGYDVDYLRVPVTDEKAPKTSDFAILAARAWAPPEGAAMVYNCQVLHVKRVGIC